MDVGVLIAGAGPVGLSLACELERHRVQHRTVDAARERAAVSRATDLHARSLELWDLSPIVGGDARGRALGVLPGPRVPDAGPLVRGNGSATSLRELLRAAELQLWICAGAGPADSALALAERFTPAVRATVIVIADRPRPGPSGVEVLADPELRAHGRLGAVADAAYVVRPDGHLGFRCESPDAARLAEHLALLGVGT